MQRAHQFLTIICILIAAVSAPKVKAESTVPSIGHGYVPGRFLVRVAPDARVSLMRSASAGTGSLTPLFPPTLLPGFEALSRYYVFTASQPGMTVGAVSSALGSGSIEQIEQDQYIDFYGVPTDPYFTDQWYLRNLGQTYFGISRVLGDHNDQLVTKQGIAGNDIRIAGYYTTPPAETTKVTVAIIDTGTDMKHPELAGRFWRNPGEIAGNGRDDDHNGYVDDTSGFDISGDSAQFFNIVGDNDPTDHLGHGTHLAGIVAANGDGAGVVGIAPWVQIMPVKIYPNAYMSIGTLGILYAVNNGARIINISWGTPYETVILKEALDYARANGVFVSIAAGNTGDNTRGFPAAFDSSFTVGAGDSRGAEATFSTFGPFVDIIAPGVDMLSLRAAGTDMYAEANEPFVRIIGPDSLYYLADGTSMAAPTVAGSAALIWSFRPDLSLAQMENILRLGAVDMLDPRQQGDSLVGPDTLSGYGYLCVQCSMNLLQHGGIALTSPESRVRLGGYVPVTVSPEAGYKGSWQVEYALGDPPANWQPLAQGDSLKSDSVLVDFYQPELNQFLTFRVTDQFGTSKSVTISYVNSDSLNLESPQAGDTLRFSVPIAVKAFGPLFDSLSIFYRSPTNTLVHLSSSTEEYFGTTAFTWNVSGVKAGNYSIIVRGYFGGTVRSDSSTIYMASAFAAGWPQTLPGRSSQTPVSSDLNGDGIKEIIVGTLNGLCVFEPNGTPLPHFPVLPAKDMRCVPAIYDVDGDGNKEIVCTNEDGLHAFKFNGTEAAGFPVSGTTGRLVFGFPTPTIAPLVQPITGQSAPTILYMDTNDSLHAFQLNGKPMFGSKGGGFAAFTPYQSIGYFFGGNELSVTDINGDGKNDVIATYASIYPPSGVGVFDGRTGQPEFNQSVPQILGNQLTYGSVLTDFTGDSIPEIVVTGQGPGLVRTVWVLTRKPDGSGMMNLPGWPIQFPEQDGWIGNIPMVGDLDLDGIPEIVFTAYEFDIGSVYAFRADGTPYLDIPGRPRGEIFNYPVTMGVPIIANLTGDAYPEILFRGGYILPGSGTEKLFALDHVGTLLPGYPIPTPTPVNAVISTPFAPMVDDIDGDGKVDLLFTGDGSQLYVWNFDAPSLGGKNHARLGADETNSHIYPSTGATTGIDDHGTNRPSQFALAQNYPNPFNPMTTISFDLATRSHVRLDVFNILGQIVRTPLDDEQTAGHHAITFDASGMASGVYLYRLMSGAQMAVKKMVVLK